MTGDSGTRELADGRPGHRLVRREDVAFTDPYPGRGSGFESCRLVDGSTGSTHMALTLCSLTDGHLDTHLHSYEESFYVLEGQPVLYLDGRGVELKPGACGVVPVGVPHAWRGDGPRALGRDGRPASAPRRQRHVLPRRRARGRRSAARRPRPAQPQSLPAHRGRDGSRSPEARRRGRLRRPSPRAWRPPLSPTAESPSRCSSTSGSTPSSTRCSWSTTSRAPSRTRTTTRSRSRTTCSRARSTSSRTVNVTRSGPGDVFWTATGCVHAFYETQGGRVRWLETSAPGARHRGTRTGSSATGTISPSVWSAGRRLMPSCAVPHPRRAGWSGGGPSSSGVW